MGPRPLPLRDPELRASSKLPPRERAQLERAGVPDHRKSADRRQTKG